MKLHLFSSVFLAVFVAGTVAGCSDASVSTPGAQVGAVQSAVVVADDAVVGEDVTLDAVRGEVAQVEPAAGETEKEAPAERSLETRDVKICEPVVQHVVINEMMIDPVAVGDAEGEWIELYNPSSEQFDLQGWYIAEDGPGIHQIVSSLVIEPNGYLVLCRNPDPLVNGGVACDYGLTNFGLQNGGDSVLLLDQNLTEIDRVVYGPADGLTTSAPVGASVGLKHPYLDNEICEFPENPDDPEAWDDSNFGISVTAFGVGDKGTPGARNDGYEEQEHPTCYDANVCTWDACEGGICNNVWKEGCCLSNSHCADDDICTQDLCNLNTLTCTNDEIEGCCESAADCIDDNPCNEDYCVANRCRYSAYNINPGCCYAPVETNPTTGLPWSSEAERIAFANSQCDDKKFCTPDYCNMGTNLCESGEPLEDCCNLNSDCDDGNYCTYDMCWNHQCTHDLISYGCCLTAEDCDDNDPCTTDTCWGNSCRHSWDSNNCCYDHAWCVANADDGNPCTDERCMLDPVSGRFTCQHPYLSSCAVGLPYIEPFDGISSFQAIGWSIDDRQTDSTAHWNLASNEGNLGPDTHVAFTWDPLPTIVVKTVAMGPSLDATTAASGAFNQLQKTTLQWRMAYTHSAPGQSVTLKVVASDNTDLFNGAVVWEATVLDDIEYTLMSVELPDTIKFSPTLRIGFMVDTTPGSTYILDSWEIDDVKVAAGRANHFLHAKVYTCPQNGLPCNTTNGQLVAQSSAEGEMPAMTVDACSWTRIYMCYYDEDAYNTTWQYYGYPVSYLDGPPLDQAPFMFGAEDVGQGGFCDTLPNMVQLVCGVPAVSIDGYYYCGIDIKPDCNEEYAGSYRAGLISQDEYDKTGVSPLHSPFESLTKFDLTVLLEDGYIVWSPNGMEDPSAVAIKDAIKAAGRKAQIIKDLAMIPSLANYDGVFAVLGVKGRYTALSPMNAARLRLFLDAGGRVYVEGGDFFHTASGVQASTVLHPYFKAEATSDGGTMRLAGPVEGKNFLHGATFDVAQIATVNAWIDKLIHTPEAGGREIMRNADPNDPFAVTVSYEGDLEGVIYRTIGTSLPFSALVAQGSMTSTQLMTMYLNFLENGYPPCSTVANCEDFEVCTTDYCNVGECANLPIAGCIPCENDKYRPDGSLSCGINQACDTSVGYCVDIPGFRWDAECNTGFGASPVSATCSINVASSGVIDSANFKLKLAHEYRGDVRLTLTSPAGTSAVLRGESLADAKENIYETYDIGVAPTEPVTVFDGEGSSGTWTVVAQDTDPSFSHGTFEGWHLFGELTEVACTTEADCPQSLCQIASCVDSTCVFTPKGCDDGRDCTIDSCNPETGECEYEVIEACGGPCSTHDDCFRNEACLLAAEDRVCDPAVDIDPVSGESLCVCAAIEGQIYEYDWQNDLPADIPDDGGLIGLTKVLTVNASGYVKTMKVKIKTAHEASGDLRAELCHEGVCVRLRDAKGGTNPGFHDIYDWDPVVGPGDLGDFTRLPVGGDWTLKVWDNVTGMTGQLVYFTLYVISAGCYDNAACDDNNLCTLDACINPNNGGTCVHSPKSCEPTDNPCLANVCEPATGNCVERAAEDGAPCSDGLFCTEDDFCQAGLCTAGAPVDCSYLDGNCTVGSCSEDLDQCIVGVADDGTVCDDGEPCNAGDFCQAGECQPGPTLVCGCPSGLDSACLDDGNKCNGVNWICNADKMCELADEPVVCEDLGIPCRSNVCDPFDGTCKMRSSLNYVPCEDGMFCTVADYCLSGECMGGGARDCTDLDGQCKYGYCDEDENACTEINRDDGTVCEFDGLGCSNDTCQGGECLFSSVVDCSDTGDECNEGICQNVGWGGHVCIRGAFPDGTPCGDEPDPCTEDTCQLGVCEHDKLVNCNGPCGGDHPFDAGDDVCGLEDSCVGGIDGFPNGGCSATCPDGMCYKAASGTIDLPISERVENGGCIAHSLLVNTGFAYVSNAELKMRLDHESLSDLTIDLIDPQGARHRVWNNLGEDNDGFANTFDLSFPIPYPMVATSGQPMCGLRGEQIDGTWTLQVCDVADGNSGVLHDWNMYLKGSDDVDLNLGNRCEDAIDLGNQDVNPAIFVDGTLECALDTISDSGCGGVTGPDRMYKFNLTNRKRVTVSLLPVPGHRLILFMKDSNGVTCDEGSRACGETTDDQAATIDLQLDPGDYYIGVDTNGGMFEYTPFRFELRVKTLLQNGSDCVDDILGSQDLDCQSLHCQNGFCCDEGDCCPSDPWEFGGDGYDPYELQLDPDWIVTDAVCPPQYKEEPICNDPDVTDPENPINWCQGKRWDARCVNNQCVKTEVADDTACDDTVESDNCGFYYSMFCGDYGPILPAVQLKPECLTYCTSNTDCDENAHCDPVVATDPDPDPSLQAMFCTADLPNGAASNEDSDCISGHSQNGYCCNEGDCCPSSDEFGAGECPSQYTTPASCDTVVDPLTGDLVCEGHRKDPICVDNRCGDVLVRDDCRCGNAVADNCGAFIPAVCPVSPTGDCPGAPWTVSWQSGGTACLTSCLTNGVPDDSKCDDDARCDWDEDNPTDAICIPLVPNGGPCEEDIDCINQQWLPGGIGHCQNGFCCDFGDCCSRENDCPTETPRGGYWGAPTCDDWSTCQGNEKLATCIEFRCGSEYSPEDSACIFDLGSPSDECGYYKPIFCNGDVDQIDPPCPTTCLEDGTGVELDEMCDDNAHCDPVAPTYSNAVCLADLANDQPCDEDSDCVSSYCQAGYCCDVGGCCAGCKVTNAVPSFGNAGYEGPVSTEYGFMQVAPTVPLAERPAVGGRTIGAELGTFESVTIVTGCYDRIKGQAETDVDCGGRVCPACASGKYCIYGTDCQSGTCTAGRCE